MIHTLHYTNYGGRKVLTQEEQAALNVATSAFLSQSVSDLRSAWRTSLMKEAQDRKLEIEELCNDFDLPTLNSQLKELISIEGELPPLPKGFIRPECYACALPIAGYAVRGAHGRMFHERCFSCKQCGTHLSCLAPTCVALYDQHYCMPCGARFEPQEHVDAPPTPIKTVALAATKSAVKENDAATPDASATSADACTTAAPAADSPASSCLADHAKSRLLSVFSRLETRVDEMDEEEKKLVAQIDEEQARIKDVDRRQRVERFRARQSSLNLAVGQQPSADAIMAAARSAQPEAIDQETLKSLDKEHKLYTSSEQLRKKQEQQERLMRFKSSLNERKNDTSRSSESIGDSFSRSSDAITEDEETERKRKEQEILDLIADEERRRQQEERSRQVANVKFFLDDLKQSTLAVLEKEATGARVSASEIDVVERNLERADEIFGVETSEAAPASGEGRFEQTLDRLLSLMENPDALAKLAQLVSPNVAPQGQSHVAYYEKVKQDTEWARKQREAREAELANMRRQNN